MVNFIRKYSQKKHYLFNKRGIQQDGGIGACQNMRTKIEPVFADKVGI